MSGFHVVAAGSLLEFAMSEIPSFGVGRIRSAHWFGVKERYKGRNEKVKEIVKACLSNNKTWDMFTNIEFLYKDFILSKSKRTYRCPTERYRKHQNWNLENAKNGVYL